MVRWPRDAPCRAPGVRRWRRAPFTVISSRRMLAARSHSYAVREFYARNPRLAPKPSTRHKRLATVALIVLLAGVTVAGMYLRPSPVDPLEVGARVQQFVPGGGR